jgi:hypothetical protein
MADKAIQLLGGRLTEVEATVVSTGVAQAGDILALDANGKISNSVLPTGVGADVAVIAADEDLAPGDYVNIFDDAGTPKVRLADNSAGSTREAHGFVKANVVAPANATVYFEGGNDDLTGLTVGARYFLGTAGQATAAPPAQPAADISQLLGIAINATTINTDIDDIIVLA